MHSPGSLTLVAQVSDAFEEAKDDVKEFYAMLGRELMKRMVIVA